MARSKNRLFSKFIRHINDNARVITTGLSENLQSSVTTAVDSAAVAEIVSNTAVDSAAVSNIIGNTSNYIQLNQAGTLEATTGTIRYVLPKNIVINAVEATLGTAASGSNCVIVLNKNGSSINTVTINDGSSTSSNTGLSLSVSDGDYLTHNITTASGSDLNLIITYVDA